MTDTKTVNIKSSYLLNPAFLFAVFIFFNTVFIVSSYLMWRLDVIDGTSGYLVWGTLLAIFVDISLLGTSETLEKPAELTTNNIDYWWKKWFVRYSLSVLYFLIALILFEGWHNNEARGLGILLINPIFSGLVSIYAIFKAWELSLLLISIGLLYLLYVGITMLPVTVAILLGVIVISWAIVAYK